MFIRRTFAALCASLLTATLLSLGVTWSAWHIFSQPNYIKQTLRTSGIYQTLTDNIIKQQEAQLSNSQAGAAISQPEVQSIIKQSLTPDIIQGQAEHFIDGSTDWAQGKSSSLNANIDLTAANQKLADNLATYAENRAKSLPVCTAATIATTSTDPFQATCLPPGITAKAVGDMARANILNDDNLKDNKLSADQIPTGNGKTLQDQLQNGPKIYRYTMWTVYGQVVLAVIVAIGLILLSASRRIGMRRVGIIALWTGLVNAGIALLSSYGIHFISQKIAQTHADNPSLQQNVLTIVQRVVDDIKVWWLYYSAALVVIGIILLIVYRLTRPTSKEQAEFLAQEAGIDISELADKTPDIPNQLSKTAPPATTTKPGAGNTTPTATPRRRPRRIQ